MRRKIVGDSGVRPSSHVFISIFFFLRGNPEGDIMRRAYLRLGEILIILVQTSLQSVIKRIVWWPRIHARWVWYLSRWRTIFACVDCFLFLLHAPRTCERKWWKKKCQYHTKLARLGVIQSQFQILFFPMDWVHRRLPRKLREKRNTQTNKGES